MPHTLGELQAAIGAWLQAHPDGVWPPLANLARLTEEVGELARALNQLHGPKRVKPGERAALPRHIADELADIVLVCCVIASSHDLDLDAAMERCLARAKERAESKP
jgi:NTP pyrophosphatase (non-canonical NTP hydrolase)